MTELVEAGDPHMVSVDVFFGWVALESRFRRDGDRLIGEGRCLRFGPDGKLIELSPWRPSGVEVLLP